MVEEVFGKLIGDLCWPNIIGGQENQTPQECIFGIQSFERICGYFPRKGPVSLVTGPVFTGACTTTGVFANL